MLNRKSSKQSQPGDDETLVKRVDAMMDPKKTDSAASASKADAPIDIFKDLPATEQNTLKTAPEVPGVAAAKVDAPRPEQSIAPNAEPRLETQAAPNTDEPDKFNDTATNKAVDDIAANESDAVLAAEDAALKGPIKPTNESGWKAKLTRTLKNKWTWISLGALLIILFALPVTRYKLLGLVVKKSITISVVDSKTATPVSNAQISLGGTKTKTDPDGTATLKASVGKKKLEITKQYYTSYSTLLFVGFKTGRATSVHLAATGRRVPITIINTITGKPLANAEIRALNTTAKTNAQGKATIVLPAKTATDAATITLSGYNTTKTNIQVTDAVVSANTFALTPAGHLYFLSNLNGSIDVVKTNLDGSSRKTILAGTGHEDPGDTSLLASRDWRYLVLKSQRDGTRAALYLIDTSDDKLTAFDNSNASFNIIGWYGHDFLYQLQSNTTPQSQAGHEVIKSYDADHSQLSQLDQTQVEGSATSYAYQDFYNFYIVNNALVYNTQWYTYDAAGGSYDISSKSDTIRAVQPGGQNKKDYQSFPAAGLSYIQATLYSPQAIYYAVASNDKTTYYEFENQTVSSASTLSQSDFNKTYPTYLLSPSGNQTFWTEPRDGKNTLFSGDVNAHGAKQIATLSDYAPYGWYSDNYLLVSKNSSELYVMPASGYTAQKPPLKITDYYKPPRSLTGYGYGYGGL